MSKIKEFMDENAMVKNLNPALQEADAFYFEMYCGDDVYIFTDYQCVYEWRFHHDRLCDMKCTWISTEQGRHELEEKICSCVLNCAYAEKGIVCFD